MPPKINPKMEEEDLSSLIHSRCYLRQKLTRKYNSTVESIATLTKLECEEYLEFFKASFEKLSVVDEQIGSALSESKGEAEMNKDLGEAEEYEKKTNECIRKLKTKLAEFSIPSNLSSDTSITSDANRPTKLKLPEMPLPQFSHKKDESLVQFFINFEDIIKKYNISDYERFVYLDKQLSGDPLTLIRSLIDY